MKYLLFDILDAFSFLMISFVLFFFLGVDLPRVNGVSGSPLPGARLISTTFHGLSTPEDRDLELTHLTSIFGFFWSYDFSDYPAFPVNGGRYSFVMKIFFTYIYIYISGVIQALIPLIATNNGNQKLNCLHTRVGRKVQMMTSYLLLTF